MKLRYKRFPEMNSFTCRVVGLAKVEKPVVKCSREPAVEFFIFSKHLAFQRLFIVKPQ